MKKLVRFVAGIAAAVLLPLGAPLGAVAADAACTITVTESNTTVNGTNLGDVICLNANDVIVNALDGDDTVIDNGDNNTINLGGGNDIYDGTEGDNAEVYGELGDDIVEGTPTGDLIDGGDGDDNLMGEAGPDTLNGGDGDDVVAGGVDLDTLDGGADLNVCDFDAGEAPTSTCRYDDAGPKLVSAEFATTTVDSGPAATSVSVHFKIKDDLGVSQFMLDCASPSATLSKRFVFSQWWKPQNTELIDNTGLTSWSSGDPTPPVVPIVGNTRSFEFDTSFPIRRGLTPGAYTCRFFALDIHLLQTWVEFGTLTVTRTGTGFDDDGPVIKQTSFSKPTIDVGAADQEVVATVRLVDAAGIGSMNLSCAMDSHYVGAQMAFENGAWVNQTYRSPTVTITGKATDTTFKIPLIFKKGWKPGNYWCNLNGTDLLGNRVSPIWVSLPKIIVKRTGTGFDDDAPAFSEFTMDKTKVEVGASDEEILFHVRVKDVTEIYWLSINCGPAVLRGTVQEDKSFWVEGVLPGRFTLLGDTKDFDITAPIKVKAGSLPGIYDCVASASDTLGNVTAYNSVKLGKLEVRRTPLAQPSAPKNLTAPVIGSSKVTLNWDAPDVLGTPALYSYGAQYSTDGVVWKNFTAGGYSATNSITLTGLLGNKNYWLRVRGENGGTVGLANLVGFMDLNWTTTQVHTAPPVAPSVPTSIGVSAKTGVVTLSWKAPADNGGSVVRDYLVEYSKNGSGKWFKVVKGKSNATTVKIPGLRKATTYLFRISAVTNDGTSGASKSVKVVTK